MYIELSKDKEPYIKEISNDKVINLTGESGSGKSYFSRRYDSCEYIVIDTDEVFGRFDNSSGYNREFGEYLRKKYDNLPDICNDFDTFYVEVLDYFSNSDKTLVIDSAQFRNIKNINLLKGKVIVIRTCVDTCYKRCIDRWINSHDNYSEDELNNYKNKKKGIFKWYLSINNFIDRINDL